MSTQSKYAHEPGTCSFCDRMRLNELHRKNVAGLADVIAEERGYVKQVIHPTAEELLDCCEESVCPTKQDILPSILLEAQRLVHGDRNETYGYPWQDYARTVGAFKALMGDKSISEMTAIDGMLFMVCVKLSRQINLPKRDNLVDAAGYLECINWSIEQVSKDTK